MAPSAAADALAELLARLGAAPGRAVVVSSDELQHWPVDAVAAFKAHGALRPGKPGNTAVCPGCERACVMPVQQRQQPARAAAAFVVCDKRDDVGRVALTAAHLERWRVDGQTLGDALASLLGTSACYPVPGAAFVYRLGVATGSTDKAQVHLRFDNSGQALLDVAGHTLELAAVVAIMGSLLVLDVRQLGRCADAPAGGAALPRETPAQRTARLLARKAALRQRGVKAFLPVLAEEEGVSVSMVKRLLGRVPVSEASVPAAPAVPAWAAVLAPAAGVSPGGKRKR